MDKEAARYKRAVAKRLSCSVSRKWKLLNGFQESLDRFLEEVPSPGSAQLIDAFGPPEELASTMMGKVSDQEKKRYVIQEKVFKALFVVAFILALIFGFYAYFIKEWTIIEFHDSVEPVPTTYESTAPLEGD